MFPFPDPVVRVGLVPDIALDQDWNTVAIAKQHGVLLAKRYDTGSTVNLGIVVDKPKHLVNPHPELLNDVYSQIKQMGYYPISVDIRVGDRRRVYEPGKDEPILDQRRK
jgi:hypothetical protein